MILRLVGRANPEMEDLETFLAVVEEGSQTAAARRLGRSLQAVNRSLAALEKSLGVELVRRTTRHSFATEAGLAFYERIKPAIAEIAEARAEAAGRRMEARGRLRIGAPVLFAARFVVPAVTAFIARHPAIEVDLAAADRPFDVIGEGLDLAIRVRRLRDSSLRSRNLGEVRVVVFAAPAYLERHGRPERPADLCRHACVLRRVDDAGTEVWQFREDERDTAVAVAGPLRVDEMASLHAAVRAGVGLGRGPYWQIREEVERGAMEILLAAFEAPPIPVQAVVPPSRLPPAKTRLFIEQLAARLADEVL